jgi:Bacteriophage head to tail connecting protein
MKVFRLDRYVVARDTMGKLLEIVVKVDVSRRALDDSQMAAFIGPGDRGTQDASAKDGDVPLYTWIKLDSTTKMWSVHQEICGRKVPDSEGSYPEEKSPWIVLRWTCVDNEDYGRGYIEEYLGDLKSLEALTKALVQGAQAAAKVLFLVNPNGSTNARQIAEAPNGTGTKVYAGACTCHALPERSADRNDHTHETHEPNTLDERNTRWPMPYAERPAVQT